MLRPELWLCQHNRAESASQSKSLIVHPQRPCHIHNQAKTIMADLEAQIGRSHDPKRLDGFPALSNFMGADQEGTIFQRFDRLSARNLLYLQSNLNELQAKLDKLDHIDAIAGVHDTGTKLSAKAYSDLKATAKEYQEEQEGESTVVQHGVTGILVQNGEDEIGAGALERIELHRQIKEAMRDYRRYFCFPCAMELTHIQARH
jgi:hypothetical protein